MMNSPCATFTTLATPQIKFKPCATTAKTQPSRSPRARSVRNNATSAMRLRVSPAYVPV